MIPKIISYKLYIYSLNTPALLPGILYQMYD